MRATLATVVVAFCGAAAFWWGTEGGSALTSEAARRLDIARAPRALPDVPLYDQNGAQVRLSDYRRAPLVLEFVYTTCPDICLTLGTAFEQLDALLPAPARMVSVSFDPDDDRERLASFADRYAAMPPRWRIAGVEGDAARTALLKRAGVVVIPDGFGGFVHNAGLYLVDAEGRLTAIFDPEDTGGLRAAFAALAGHAR